MRFKLNVTVTWTKTNLAIKSAIEQACAEVISPHYDPECTSGLEGTHSDESGHYHGRALDIGIRDMPHLSIDNVCERAQALLGSNYLVLREATHIHIQRNKDTF